MTLGACSDKNHPGVLAQHLPPGSSQNHPVILGAKPTTDYHGTTRGYWYAEILRMGCKPPE